jgi:hypothetical protein
LQQVFANPREYPLALWDLAEIAASAAARKAVRTVSQIAKEERWFVD